MNRLEMKTFGSVLTGREFGSDIMKRISKEFKAPLVLDFAGVNSLGSSFADEVLIPIAKLQGHSLTVSNVKPAVWDCIQDVAKDGGIKIDQEL